MNLFDITLQSKRLKSMNRNDYFFGSLVEDIEVDAVMHIVGTKSSDESSKDGLDEGTDNYIYIFQVFFLKFII